MNKALFSRGPWKHIVNRTTISDADGDRIATVVRKGLYHYTAELIAAAPEMYGLLKEILNDKETLLRVVLAVKLLEVLKKARGEE